MAERALAPPRQSVPEGRCPLPADARRGTRGLREAKLDDVKRFHAQFAGGAAAELAIVGDFDADAVKAQLGELFGTWKSRMRLHARARSAGGQARAHAHARNAGQGERHHAGRARAAAERRERRLSRCVRRRLHPGRLGKSRLWKRVREKDGLSYSVGASLQPSSFEQNSPLELAAIFAPQNRERLAKALSRRTARASSATASPKPRSPRRRTDSSSAGSCSARRIRSLAAALVQQAYLGRTFEYSAKIDAAIAAVTVADVNAALRKYVKPDAFAYVYAGTFAK